MNSKSKPTRLSKAAREFNVSTGTIVSFLKKKGYEIATNPNAKVSPEMYELLLKEYSQEKSVKEEAKKHNLKYTKKRSISLEDKEEEKESEDTEEEDEPDEFEDTIFIKNTSFSSSAAETEKEKEQPDKEEAPESKEETVAGEETPKTSPEARQASVEEKETSEPETKQEQKEPESDKKEESEPPQKAEEEKTERSGVKVLGKIDVDSIEPKRGKSGKKAAADKPKKKPAAADKEKSGEKTEEQKEKPAVEKQQQKQPEQEQEKGAKAEAKESSKETSEDKSKEKPVSEKTEKKTPEGQQAAQKEAKEKTEHKKEAASQDRKQKAQTQKPAAKKADEKKTEEPAPKEPEQEQKKPKEKQENNFIKTKVEKLDGPKILGTIDLPESKKPVKKKQDRKKEERKKRQEKKKPVEKKSVEKKPENEAETDQGKRKPVASSKDESIRPKKKRRKRIKPEISQQDSGGKGNSQVSRGQRPKPKPGKKTPKKGKKPLRHEPTEEEVQKQLKETMARLSGGGKSKSSKHRRNKRDAVRQKEQDHLDEDKSTIKVTEFVTVNELASMMDVNVNEVISTCMSLGLFVSINQRLDAETINLVSDEFGYNVEFVSVEVQEALDEQEAEEEEVNEEELEPRAPIITVMGHVDHGKTSLLDYIRQENVIGGEAGGITQHIGAYEVITQSEKKITFLDTPGHEAFTAMRARGAQVTDIAIIIVAADDQIMPQTVEAINHAQAAGVPIVFAINKVDKPGANPVRIKEQLSHRNILVEEWGGKYQSQEISAKNGDGIEELLEKVLLEAEILDLKGSPGKHAKGAVVESSLDKGRGYIAKLLVQDGTLKKSDYVLAGAHSGKVRAMYNELNQQIDEAGPSTPVLMLGLDGAPQAGDQFNVFEDEREAKDLANKRRQLQREQGIRTQKHVTLDEIGRRIAIGDFKELNIIVKGDVDGSVEALADALLKLGTEEVQVNVIHKSVGQISESDIMLASASEAIIVGFQVRPSMGARRLAEKEQIDIRTYSVIYKAIEEVKSAIEGMLAPKIEEKVVANIEVRDVFKITKVGTVAGCKVLDGVITRNTRVRVIRDGIVIYTGELGSLKRYKEDAKEVRAGYECGLNIQSFNDIKVGDIIEGFKEVQVERKLDD